jgi:hypothetical protein
MSIPLKYKMTGTFGAHSFPTPEERLGKIKEESQRKKLQILRDRDQQMRGYITLRSSKEKVLRRIPVTDYEKYIQQFSEAHAFRHVRQKERKTQMAFFVQGLVNKVNRVDDDLNRPVVIKMESCGNGE